MIKFEIVELGTLISEYSKRNKDKACTNVYSVTNSTGFMPSVDYFSKEVFSKDVSTYKIVQKGMFAYNPSRVNVGSLAFLESMEQVVVSPLYVIFRIDEKKLSHRYLNYFLHSEQGLDQIRNLTSGSVRDSLKYSALSRIQIPLPTLETQERYSAVLDRLTLLISKRKEQIVLLEQTSKEMFIDMFGDLLSNSMKWNVKNILEVASFDTRMTKDFDFYAEMPHVGIENIEKETGAIINTIKVKDSGLLSGKYPFDERHIIYSKIRPNLNKVALPAITGLCSADSYPILVKDNICERTYLAYVLRSGYFLKYILSFSGRTNIPKVNKKQISNFDLPVPPFELQQDFKHKHNIIGIQKSDLQNSLAELETTYKATLQKAFNGELF